MRRHWKPGCGPSNVLPAVVYPTKQCVNHTFSNNIVPHIHPTHTTNVHHVNFQHVNYYPQNQSNVTEVTHQNFYGGSGPVPTPFNGGAFGMGGSGFGSGSPAGNFGMGWPYRKK